MNELPPIENERTRAVLLAHQAALTALLRQDDEARATLRLTMQQAASGLASKLSPAGIDAATAVLREMLLHAGHEPNDDEEP